MGEVIGQDPDFTLSERMAFAHSLLPSEAHLRDVIVSAFAAVPRENFLPRPPWVAFREGEGELTVNDARELYSVDLVQISTTKINSGDPRLWSQLFSSVEKFENKTVIHIGAGLGYYTAVLSRLVGKNGEVRAWEIDPTLALSAKHNLASYTNVELIHGNGLSADVKTADIVIACAGLSCIPAEWLRNSSTGATFLFPFTVNDTWEAAPGLTVSGGRGWFLRLLRRGDAFDAKFLRPVSFIPCVGGHAPQLEDLLRGAFAAGGIGNVKSLNFGPGPSDRTWLQGDGWHLSFDEKATS